jgi:hypothetical protein
VSAATPGKAAHDTWCADDDWDLLDDEARDLWEDTAQAGHAAIVAQESKLVVDLDEEVTEERAAEIRAALDRAVATQTAIAVTEIKET